MSEYRIHWTAYHVQKAERSGNATSYYRKLSMPERGAILNYMNSVTYGYPEDNPSKMDRTVFSMRARPETNRP